MYDISHSISFLKMAIKAIKDGRLYTARSTIQVAALEINELIRRRSPSETEADEQPPLPLAPPEGPEI